MALLSRAWPDFCALHMTWGAINELTTLTAYRRLSKLAGHPILTDLLERIMLDESRHFFFYYRQAEARLLRPGAARVSRAIVDRFWAPVGSGEQGREELRSWPASSSATRRGAPPPARSTRPSGASRVFLGAPRRALDRFVPEHAPGADTRAGAYSGRRRTEWRRPRLSPIAPTRRARSPAPSGTPPRCCSAASTGAWSASSRPCSRTAATRRASCRWRPRRTS